MAGYVAVAEILAGLCQDVIDDRQRRGRLLCAAIRESGTLDLVTAEVDCLVLCWSWTR